ncbi:MAG TPA: radical SAM protein [bacterium]|nr:radical SAM protein [bacterium]
MKQKRGAEANANENEEYFFSRIWRLDDKSAPLPVFVGGSCNLNCVHCPDKSLNSPGEADRKTILEQLSGAAARHVPAISFVGGEPAIHKSFPALISIAKELSIPFIGARTNAMTLSYPGRAEKLRDIGLCFIRVSNFLSDPVAFDALTRTPGSHEKVRSGILNSLAAGLEVSISIPVFNQTISKIDKDIASILDHFAGIKAIDLSFVCGGGRAPSISEAERILPALVERSFGLGIPLTFAPFEGIPPCLFSAPETLIRVFRYPAASYFPRRAFKKTPSCAECPLDSLCNGAREEYESLLSRPGFKTPGPHFSAALARSSVLTTQGTTRDSLREKLPAEGNAVTISFRSVGNADPIVNDCVVRTNFRCNQDCLFCFVDTRAADPPDLIFENTARELKDSKKTISIVSFSGGEPAMNPRLADFVSMFRETGALEICVQTNASLISGELARALAESGVDSAFVSLHSCDPAVSDMITGLRGAFRKTLTGIENLSANGIFVYISHVINSFNFSSLPAFASFVAEKLGRAPIVFSFAAPHTNEMMFAGSIPSLSVVRGPLRESLEICLSEKIPFSGLPGMCGLPLCVLGPDLRYYPDIHRVSQESLQGTMRKHSGCAECAMNDWCYGLREFYADKRGMGELTPLKNAAFSPKPRDILNRLEFFRSFYDEERNANVAS